MPASILFEPVSAPHKTKRFWLFVALGLVVLLCAPVIQILLGLPPFPRRVQISSGAITFALWVIAFWFGLRFGRIAWLTIATLMAIFALLALFHL